VTPPDPLLRMLAAGQFEPYIRHIRFPHFRNLRDGTRIDFDYPVTALVGPNGTNKTAILRALQGCPDQTNIGLYWFSTSLDPIGPEDRHRFIHSYRAHSTGQIVEAVKSRIARTDPDAFEPARPILSDKMGRMPPFHEPLPPERTRTRWKAIRKPVVYLDFRSELSAYDKFFYHTPLTKRISSLVEKKKFIRSRSSHLAKSMGGRSSHIFRRSERIIEPARQLNAEQVSEISKILGRKYESITLLRHRYFNDDGYSVVLHAPNLTYSEAFAGSGEFAVTMLVFGVTEALPSSLVLLDEPEVSLHPGAQRNLMAFIRQQAKLKRHQFVISTHAPEIVRDLPPQAIKVFQSHPIDGRIDLISQASDPVEAFFRLGVPAADVYTIYVEDALAAAIVTRAIRLLGEATCTKLKIEILPGGAGSIQTRLIPALALAHADCLILLDGDQSTDPLKASEEIPDAELKQLAKDLLGGTPQLSLNGGASGHSISEEFQQLRTIINWHRSHVDYLPGSDPDSLLFELIGDSHTGSSQVSKERWEARTREALGRPSWETVTSSDILSEQDRTLAKVSSDNAQLLEISDKVTSFLRSRGS
jgi:AAA domain, putative AbiEii toxin, Type IV TA system